MAQDEGTVNATQGAKDEAEARGIDLAAIGSGSGKDGQVTKNDVTSFADELQAQVDAAEAEKVYEARPNPKRTATEVVVQLDGVRRSFSTDGAPALVTADERSELAQYKGEALDGSEVQLLTFKEVQ